MCCVKLSASPHLEPYNQCKTAIKRKKTKKPSQNTKPSTETQTTQRKRIKEQQKTKKKLFKLCLCISIYVTNSRPKPTILLFPQGKTTWATCSHLSVFLSLPRGHILRFAPPQTISSTSQGSSTVTCPDWITSTYQLNVTTGATGLNKKPSEDQTKLRLESW